MMEMVNMFKEGKNFCTISVGKNCKDGFNALLFTVKRYDHLLLLVVMIYSHDIINVREYILFPQQVQVFFRDYISGFLDFIVFR